MRCGAAIMLVSTVFVGCSSGQIDGVISHQGSSSGGKRSQIVAAVETKEPARLKMFGEDLRGHYGYENILANFCLMRTPGLARWPSRHQRTKQHSNPHLFEPNQFHRSKEKSTG